MNIGLFCSTYLSGLIMPDVYRTNESFFIGLVDRLRGHSIDYQEGTVASNMVVNRGLLSRSPADSNQLIVL